MGMTSSAHIASQAGGFEPQREWMAGIQIVGVPSHLNASLKSGFIPQKAGQDIEIPFGGTSRWVRGRRTMSTGNITFIDYVDKDTLGALEAWEAQHEDADTGEVMSAQGYKRSGVYTMYPPPDMGLSPRRWDIIGMFIVHLDPGNWAYGSNNVRELQVTIRYDDFKRRTS